MRRIITHAFIAIIVSASLASCGGSPATVSVPTSAPAEIIVECKTQAQAFINDVQPLVREWTDGLALAASTPRLSLAAQIDQLQDIRRRTEAVAVPDCAAPVKASLVSSMERGVAGNLAFLGEKSDDVVSGQFALASADLALFQSQLQQLQSGLPVPTPAPAFVDDLGVTPAAIEAEFPDLTWTDGSGQRVAENRDTDSIEIIGTTAAQDVFVLVSMNGSNNQRLAEMTTTLEKVLTITAPDWADSSTWLRSAIDAKQGQTIVNRGRFITFGYDPSGATTYTLQIKVP